MDEIEFKLHTSQLPKKLAEFSQPEREKKYKKVGTSKSNNLSDEVKCGCILEEGKWFVVRRATRREKIENDSSNRIA